MRVTWLAPLLVGIPAVLALMGAEVSVDNSRLPSSLDALVRRGDPDLDTHLLVDLEPVKEEEEKDPVPTTKSRRRRPVTPTTSLHTTTSKKKKKPKTKTPTTHSTTTIHIITVPPTTHTTSRHTTSEEPHPTTTSPSPTSTRKSSGTRTRRGTPTSTSETDTSPTVVVPTETSVTDHPTPTSSADLPSHSPSFFIPPISPDPTPSPSPEGSSSVTPSPETDAPTYLPTDLPITVPTTNSGTVTTRRPRPTGTFTSALPGSNSTSSTPTRSRATSIGSGKTTTTITRPITTTIIRPTTTTTTTTTAATTATTTSTTTTTTTATTTATTTTTTRRTTRSHRPTKTATPWLPSSIEPVSPPKKTQTPSPGTSLPDVVIPNLNPDIPEGSFNVHLRLQHVSYYQVINNGVLAAQLVSFIPAQLSQVLDVDPYQVLVLAIRDASIKGSGSSTGGKSRRKKRGLVTSKDEQEAILVTVAIPKTHYQALATAVADTTSSLYTPSADTFGQYLDASYPLSTQPPVVTTPSGGSKGTTGQQPSPLTGDEFGVGGPDPVRHDGSSGSTNGVLIGSLVGAATIAYVGIAMVVVRAVRRKRMRQQEEEEQRKAKISGPVSVQGSAGWAWTGSS
ncbi:hypothetical protein BG006_007694 [Podila minutissima]|uniref:Uncharacterized protein n=1 Tax=Podila minutissima TaxID=64525 RepID=A0A9P5SGP7_9FUNG|nr:hypothetical protein BG006_007694 [Podila minutissima]